MATTIDDYDNKGSEGHMIDDKLSRYSSLKFAGRYWNPYVEWREQGAWVRLCLFLYTSNAQSKD